MSKGWTGESQAHAACARGHHLNRHKKVYKSRHMPSGKDVRSQKFNNSRDRLENLSRKLETEKDNDIQMDIYDKMCREAIIMVNNDTAENSTEDAVDALSKKYPAASNELYGALEVALEDDGGEN